MSLVASAADTRVIATFHLVQARRLSDTKNLRPNWLMRTLSPSHAYDVPLPLGQVNLFLIHWVPNGFPMGRRNMDTTLSQSREPYKGPSIAATRQEVRPSCMCESQHQWMRSPRMNILRLNTNKTLKTSWVLESKMLSRARDGIFHTTPKPGQVYLLWKLNSWLRAKQAGKLVQTSSEFQSIMDSPKTSTDVEKEETLRHDAGPTFQIANLLKVIPTSAGCLLWGKPYVLCLPQFLRAADL